MRGRASGDGSPHATAHRSGAPILDGVDEVQLELDGGPRRELTDDPQREATGLVGVDVAETRVDIPEASVSDAVMMLDLRNTNALMFRNPSSGEYNMVYRRDDGTIGWVEPASK